MPTKKCYFCRSATPIEEAAISCTKCENKELDVLIGVYWFIHCYGSEFCSLRTIALDIEPVAGLKPEAPMVKSWLNRGYLERNEMNCVRVPPPVTDYFAEHGYNQGTQLTHVLRGVESQHRDKERRGLVPKAQMPVQVNEATRMVFAERGA